MSERERGDWRGRWRSEGKRLRRGGGGGGGEGLGGHGQNECERVRNLTLVRFKSGLY